MPYLNISKDLNYKKLLKKSSNQGENDTNRNPNLHK